MWKFNSIEINFMLLMITHLDPSDKDCTEEILHNFNLTDENTIEVPVNTCLTLECQLKKPTIDSRCNSTNLAFRYGLHTIVAEGIEITNNSLKLKVDTSKPTRFGVICTYGKRGLDNEVLYINIVGRPQLIYLECLNFDFNALVCYYRITKETVIIELRNKTTDLYQTLEFNDILRNDIRENVTEINESFGPFDRVSFRVSVNNSIGTTVDDHIIIETETIIVLPKNFTIELKNITAKSMIVEWKLPKMYNMYQFNHTRGCGLNCLPKTFNPDQIKSRNSTGHIIFVLSLIVPYANTEYNLILYTAVKNARNWLEQHATGYLLIKTMKLVPDNPPQIIPGGFEYMDSSNNLKFYWKPIATKFHNGDNFHSKIQEIHENGEPNINIDVTLNDTWAILYSLNRTNVYEIRLIAVNSEGISDKFSALTIPQKYNLLYPPENLKIVRNDKTYQLSWAALGGIIVDNFTIFWCKGLLDGQTSNCQKFISFKTIPGNSTTFEYIHGNTSSTIFAISSNFNGTTSGMKWFTCITTTETKMAKIEEASIIHVNGRTVKLNRWLACDTSPNITAIQITYWQKELDKTETIWDHSVNQKSTEIIIGGLVPYTDYILELAMFDGNSTGPGNRILFKTIVSEPTAPTALTRKRVTNSSIDLYWTPPITWNGMPRDYKIKYTTDSESHLYMGILENFTTLDTLHSKTEYKIRVAACHNATYCSTYSEAIAVKTSITKPEKITSVEHDGIYTWATFKNNDFKLYELRFDAIIDGEIKAQYYSITSETKCSLPKDICSYHSSIRAINLNKELNLDDFTNISSENIQLTNCLEALKINSTELCRIYDCMPGDWEVVAKIKCSQSPIAHIVFSIVVVTVLAIICKAIHVGVRRYKIITDLHVSVPMGLDKIFEFVPNDKYVVNRTKSVDELSEHSDDSPTITYDELHNEWMELREIPEYKIDGVGPSIPNCGNYVQTQQQKQNFGYVKISDLT